MNFKQLGLQQSLTDRCKQLDFIEPTPIQEKAIPIILKGADVIACAETGTGKTAAFLLPLIQRFEQNNSKGVSILVLAPTRELATQIEAACRQFAPKKLRCVALIGGTSYKQQINGLRDVNIIIATPGRLIDFMQQGVIDFSKLQTLVLDEADRMLDMGFLPSIRRILESIPKKRQTLFFSATITSEVGKIAKGMMNSFPEYVEVSRGGQTAVTIEQTVYPVAAQSKTVLLLDLLEREKFERVLVFTRTKRGADRLSHILEARAHKATRIHGDRSQSQREAALRSFKNGNLRVLVATDLAARGIDIDSVSHVINYDVPEVAEDYVHRIGRTGRAGQTGRAITLVTPNDELTMRTIEKLTGQKVERVLLPNFGGATPVVEKPKKPFRTFRSRGR